MTKSNASKAALADITPVLSVTRETLETTPARVLPLLRVIGTSKAIRGLMMKVGSLGW